MTTGGQTIHYSLSLFIFFLFPCVSSPPFGVMLLFLFLFYIWLFRRINSLLTFLYSFNIYCLFYVSHFILLISLFPLSSIYFTCFFLMPLQHPLYFSSLSSFLLFFPISAISFKSINCGTHYVCLRNLIIATYAHKAHWHTEGKKDTKYTCTVSQSAFVEGNTRRFKYEYSVN